MRITKVEGGKFSLIPDETIIHYTDDDSFNAIYIFEKDGKVTKVTPY